MFSVPPPLYFYFSVKNKSSKYNLSSQGSSCLIKQNFQHDMYIIYIHVGHKYLSKPLTRGNFENSLCKHYTLWSVNALIVEVFKRR